MVSTSSRASVTVAMLEVHAPLITMIAVLLLVITAVADPDLQIRGWGAVSKKNVRPFEPHFGLKIRWGAAPPPPRKLHWIRHCAVLNYKRTLSFCCTQQCTYNLLKVFSSDF